MDGTEKRRFKRLGINYIISYAEVGSLTEQFQSGHAVNVSPGGLFFETANRAFETGDLLKVRLTIPPTTGLLEFGGKVGGFAKVLRIDKIVDSKRADSLSSNNYGVAVEFCRPLQLCM